MCLELANIETCGGKVFGHEVRFLVEIHGKQEERRWHRKGTLRSLLRAVKVVRGFRRVLAAVEFTEEQYTRFFGSGSENGAVQWRAALREPSDRPWLQEAFRK